MRTVKKKKNHTSWLGQIITGINDFLQNLIDPLIDWPS